MNPIDTLCQRYPLTHKLIELQETCWCNPNLHSSAQDWPDLEVNKAGVADAAARSSRFAPYLSQVFPETAANNGLIESDLVPIPKMQTQLQSRFDATLPGKLLLKKDSHLPISGSIKARGGIYEVLLLAEKLAIQHGLLTEQDDYSCIQQAAFKALFSQYTIVVGSTDNLGMSIGIMSAKLGFSVTVHMSADAREWKKNKLRSVGANVVEHKSDYAIAVAHGREQANADPKCLFIDDEQSKSLFYGYSVAAERLQKQLDSMDIQVDNQYPLFVYLPCGVGGGPGGIAFGLKLIFGDNVHCFFAEPTHSPCMLLGVHTGLHDKISVQDIGIDNITAADGLAVGRASGLVGKTIERLVDGYYTISDERMYQLLATLSESEGIKLEPSALAGIWGQIVVEQQHDYLKRMKITTEQMTNSTHIVWATGGGMVPEREMDQYIFKGQQYLADSEKAT